MEASHTPSDSQPEASTDPLTTIHDCSEYLQALPQGRQAMKYAVNQAQQSVRLQAGVPLLCLSALRVEHNICHHLPLCP